MVFGSYGHFWSRSNNCVLVLRSVGGCFGGFRVLRAFLVSVQQLCTGFEVRGRVFRWFLGLMATLVSVKQLCTGLEVPWEGV